jgi:hypothetical protein
MEVTMHRVATFVAAALLAGSAWSNERLAVPEEDDGPPAYSQIQRTAGPEGYFVPHTNEWAAVPFLRQTHCIPADFDLLGFVDFTPAFPGGPPRPFVCPLTVRGFALYKNGPPPVDQAPILSQFHEDGEVPVWFAAWSELHAAAADGDLTLLELMALPSLRIGYADFYKETVQPGIERPQGPGNGRIEINAAGQLMDGTGFTLQVREQGDDGVSLLRHARIEFD